MQESQFNRELGLKTRIQDEIERQAATSEAALEKYLGQAGAAPDAAAAGGVPAPISGPRTSGGRVTEAEEELRAITEKPNTLGRMLFNPIVDPFGEIAQREGGTQKAINQLVSRLENETDPQARAALVQALMRLRDTNRRFGAILLRDDVFTAFGKKPRFKGTDKLLDVLESATATQP